jgi:biotin synthase
MKFEPRFESIINNVFDGCGPGKEECVYLLGFEPHSLESTHMMTIANDICRRRMGNTGIIYTQIGIDVAPCSANCQFCSFAEKHFNLQQKRMDMQEISKCVHSLADPGDLYGVFLMTIHAFDMDYLLEAVKVTRAALPPYAPIWVNVGDISVEEARQLKDAGVEGAYHALRLREGEDTNLDPKQRLKTFDAIQETGLSLYTCCEPIGPEHSAQEIVDRVFLGLEYGPIQLSAMRRAFVPGLPITERGQISHLRLAQITAVLTLISVSYPQIVTVACHEPNLLGLTAGSNITAVEIGANPRDEVTETAEHRGLSMNDCRRMLFEAGFTSIITAEPRAIPLTAEYLRRFGA